MKIKEQNEQRMVLEGPFGNKIVIDKISQNIVIKTELFLFIRTERIIPFTAVTSVTFDYIMVYSRHGKDTWKVSIDLVGEKGKIDRTSNRRDIFYLARQISKFIGKELVDNSVEHEYLYKVRRSPFDVSPRDRFR